MTGSDEKLERATAIFRSGGRASQRVTPDPVPRANQPKKSVSHLLEKVRDVSAPSAASPSSGSKRVNDPEVVYKELRRRASLEKAMQAEGTPDGVQASQSESTLPRCNDAVSSEDRAVQDSSPTTSEGKHESKLQPVPKRAVSIGSALSRFAEAGAMSKERNERDDHQADCEKCSLTFHDCGSRGERRR
jgi:hypothetical protein